LEKPELPICLVWIWRAFLDLHPGRNTGFAVGAISMTEIKAYCDLQQFEGETAQALLWGIRVLDNEFLRITAESKKDKK
jgi:hypothetical protein